MRVPRVRITMRRMMVAVVIAAVGVWGLALVRRSTEYRRRASHAEGRALALAGLENLIRQAAAAMDLEADRIDGDRGHGFFGEAIFLRSYKKPRDSVVAELKEMAATKVRQAAHYGRVRRHWEDLKEKYRRAARYPWLFVAPDRPEPERGG